MSRYVRRPRINEEQDPTDAVIAKQLDGTERLLPASETAVQMPELVPVDGANLFDALTVAQFAATSAIHGLVCTSIGLKRFLETGEVQTRKFRIERIIYDWPTASDEIDPMPTVALVQNGRTSYDSQGLVGGTLLEDSLDQWGKGTILQRLGAATLQLDVIVWSAHKEERRAVAKSIEDLFLVEPQEEKHGRLIVVPQYFDRVVRLDLSGSERGDSIDAAQKNQWILVASLAAEVELVRLVGSPPTMMRPAFRYDDLE